ncbi:transport permease protein [Clostridia bacterium]|nr:transport permease protein [Clostridia bacterium]
MSEEQFTFIIKPKTKWLDFSFFGEIAYYRDLVFLLVRRDFTANYKQTILGPAWAVIQPLLTTVVFTFVFGSIAKFAPAGIPSFPYYFSANMMWGFFAVSLTSTATTFTANANLMGKVYFPRLIMPISIILSQLVNLAIQFTIFLGFWVYYLIVPSGLHANGLVALLPLLVLQLMFLSFGVGVIVAACTTKYRDLAHAVTFCVQLWMYATPVVYDIAMIPARWLGLYMFNPMTPIIMTMRYAFLGVGSFDIKYYMISWITTGILALLAVMLFNRVEKTFMDTV